MHWLGIRRSRQKTSSSHIYNPYFENGIRITTIETGKMSGKVMPEFVLYKGRKGSFDGSFYGSVSHRVWTLR